MLLKKYSRNKPKYEKNNIIIMSDFGNSPNHNPQWNFHSYCDSYFILALCSLSFPFLHPFYPLRLLCTSTLKTFPFQAFALPNRGGGRNGYKRGPRELEKASRDINNKHNQPWKEMEGACIKVCWQSPNKLNTSNQNTNTHTEYIIDSKTINSETNGVYLFYTPKTTRCQMSSDCFNLIRTWGLAVKFLHRGLGKKPLHLSALHLSWTLWG